MSELKDEKLPDIQKMISQAVTKGYFSVWLLLFYFCLFNFYNLFIIYCWYLLIIINSLFKIIEWCGEVVGKDYNWHAVVVNSVKKGNYFYWYYYYKYYYFIVHCLFVGAPIKFIIKMLDQFHAYVNAEHSNESLLSGDNNNNNNNLLIIINGIIIYCLLLLLQFLFIKTELI